MSVILESNFMKVWLAAAGMIGYHITSDAMAFAIERQDSKPSQLTVIYRHPFCPIGRVERFPSSNKLYQSNNEWKLDMADYYSSAAEFKWVMPSPTGAHQIIYAHPQHGLLLGHFSRFWGSVIFPFQKIHEKPEHTP